MSFSRRLIRVVLAAALTTALGARAHAQTSAEPAGVIEGIVSTQQGSVRLPGVVVTVLSPSDQELSRQVSGEEGEVRIADLPPARYRLVASLDGFQSVTIPVVVTSGDVVKIAIDLPIAAVAESVTVVASPVVSSSGTLASANIVEQKEARLLAPGDGVQSALRLSSSVIQMPGGASIDGGRPNQVGYQVQSSSLVDPATGLSRLTLPVDAVDSVSVLANPYEVEFGRFSSGVVVVQTRRAGDAWKTAVDNLEPVLRLKRFTLLNIEGIGMFKPSLSVGGPLVPGRVFLEQTAQYHYDTLDVPSLPEDQLRTTEWFSAFTRVDAKLSSQHSLIVTGGVFPGTTKQATLGTFTPPEATVDIASHVNHAAVAERFFLNPSAFVESTVQLQQYATDVRGHGSTTQELLPETTLGNFFNQQHRDTWTAQWVETLSGSHKGPGGLHVLKAGLDLLHSGYEGTSASGPVLIARSDGSLARRLDFNGLATQAVASTDVAAFAQDRVQTGRRSYVEVGGRIDRDGIVGRAVFSPRVGAVVLVNASGSATVRGGYGLFYERTPLIAAAFDQFEDESDTRFATDGVTPLGPAVGYEHVTSGDLHTARSATWDLAYDYRVNRSWALHVGVLDRDSRHELIVDPVQIAGSGELLLDSTGRSRYRQFDVGVHVTRGSRLDVTLSYARSSAHEDLNALIAFYDSVLVPVIGANAYAPAAADAPNRFFVRGSGTPIAHWLLLGTLDWRNGLPYSIVNEMLDFVGPRNEQRFPTYVRTEVGLERQLSVARVHPWLGLRVSNAINAFLPADVQANTGSPAFGSFYNSEYRQFRILLRVER